MFAAEHSWCDNRCERCPIAARCPVAILERARDEGLVTTAPVADTLHALSVHLSQLLTSNDVGMQPTEHAARLRELSSGYGIGLMRLARVASSQHPEAARTLSYEAFLVMRKCAFLSVYIEDAPRGTDEQDDGFPASGAPLVLLLEIVSVQLVSALREIVEPSELPAFEAVHIELARLLQPLTDRVTPEARAELARRIVEGAAPSPFAIVG